MKFKSTCNKKEKINYEKEFVIDKLFADEDSLKIHQERLIKILNNPSPEELRKHLDAIVLKENAFNAIMEYIATFFEFNLNNEEKANVKNKFESDFPNKFDDKTLDAISSKIIYKGLIFNEIAKENNISISDEEARQYLDNYYKSTNNSINDFLNNPIKFDEIKSVILEEKITQWLLSKFKIKFDLKPLEETNINNEKKIDKQSSSKNSKK